MRTIAVAVLVTLLSAAVICIAQETTGEIAGAVASPDGAHLPGATIVLENPDTGFRRSTAADSAGRYRFVALPPADYHLTVSMDGFRSVTRQTRVELGRSVSNDVVEVVVEESDLVSYQSNPSYLLPRYYQQPRSVRFGFGVSF